MEKVGRWVEGNTKFGVSGYEDAGTQGCSGLLSLLCSLQGGVRSPRPGCSNLAGEALFLSPDVSPCPFPDTQFSASGGPHPRGPLSFLAQMFTLRSVWNVPPLLLWALEL